MQYSLWLTLVLCSVLYFVLISIYSHSSFYLTFVFIPQKKCGARVDQTDSNTISIYLNEKNQTIFDDLSWIELKFK